MNNPDFALLRLTAAVDDEAGPMQRRVSERIHGLIRSGDIRPGERLLEVHVARAFGVSRSPARAALQRLCAEGVLRKSAGRGYVVAGEASGAGGIAALPGGAPIGPAPRWEPVYAEVERALSSHILFRSVRITEERLAAHFGVSRTVARDVLVRMQGVGLITKDRFGRWIADRVTPSRIRDLYEVRWLLEPQALLQSAPRVGAARLRRMRASLAHALEHLPAADSPILDRLEQALHVELLAECPNQEILRALMPTRVLLVTNRYVFDLYIGIPIAVITESLSEHLRVLDAVLRADWDAAAADLAAHLRASCGHWLARLERVSPMPQPEFPPYLSELREP